MHTLLILYTIGLIFFTGIQVGYSLGAQENIDRWFVPKAILWPFTVWISLTRVTF